MKALRSKIVQQLVSIVKTLITPLGNNQSTTEGVHHSSKSFFHANFYNWVSTTGYVALFNALKTQEIGNMENKLSFHVII